MSSDKKDNSFLGSFMSAVSTLVTSLEVKMVIKPTEFRNWNEVSGGVLKDLHMNLPLVGMAETYRAAFSSLSLLFKDQSCLFLQYRIPRTGKLVWYTKLTPTIIKTLSPIQYKKLYFFLERTLLHEGKVVDLSRAEDVWVRVSACVEVDTDIREDNDLDNCPIRNFSAAFYQSDMHLEKLDL
jgi:hypothetical protein